MNIFMWIARLFRRNVRADIKVIPLDNSAFNVRWVVGISRKIHVEIDKVNRFFSYIPIEINKEPGHFRFVIMNDALVCNHSSTLGHGDTVVFCTTFTMINKAIDKAGF